MYPKLEPCKLPINEISAVSNIVHKKFQPVYLFLLSKTFV
jgi:hypothetical protein